LFSSITPTQIEPAIDHLLKENRSNIQALLQSNEPVSWGNTLQPVEDLGDLLNRAWSPASHLHSVADNDELREAYNACLPKLSDYATEMGQNKDLYLAYKSVSESDEFALLDDAQRKIIENALRDFRLSGIELDEDKQQEYKDIKKELSRLQTRFEENLLDATHAWTKHVTDKNTLNGLPESALAQAKQKSLNEDKQGWIFTLDFPSYMPVMQYADDVALRKEMYTAYITRASDQGPNAGQWDNSGLMNEILALRHRQAQLLGYESYAHYSLARKMANDINEVLDFLNDLASRSRKMAKQELKALQEFAKSEFGLSELQAWDMAYYAEKFRQHKYALSQEDLRPYFPAPQVIDGLFTIVKRLYGIDVKEREHVETWHEDVRFFDIFDNTGSLRGGFYLDLYTRTGKRGGAWMDECIVRKRSASDVQIPVAYITCNFTAPIGNDPALLTHDEVITLFHEFGHGLHHMLTLVDYPSVSGLNGVPWDAVELPSQFMENWCWEREALDLIGRHHQTGKLISDDIFEKMIAAKNFQTGMQMVRQLEFSLFDFRLHLEYDSKTPVDVQSLLDDVRRQVAVIIPPEFNRFQHSFSHIFAGGYAAGYYSYKWAEVLSADAYSKFEEDGIFNKHTGNKFLHSILEQGGVKEPMEMFINFRGREPNIDALLKHSGITA
ncbi:MAG: oligopeptidase A, partial [Gammaproteobacteria bacterium]